MKANESPTLIGLAVVFVGLAFAFWFDLWGHPARVTAVPPVEPEFTNTATVRMSAAELMRTGGDTSGLTCYACHDEAKTVQVRLDTNQNVILPEEHKDIVLRHGQNNRNNHCFNCHDSTRIDRLRTRDGRTLKIEEAPQLCGSCHGTTYRDWEAGIHGRTSGFWDRKGGAQNRQDCTACHDPHAPAFPPIKPAPAPHGPRSASAATRSAPNPQAH